MDTPIVQIERKHSGIRNWFNYEIIILNHPPNSGSAEVKIEPLSYYSLTPSYPMAKALGLADDDLTVYIDKFYPHGHRDQEPDYPHLRRGIATQVLTRIIEDSIADGAKLLHVASKKPEMQAFMEKQGTIYLPGYKGVHYCKLIVQL